MRLIDADALMKTLESVYWAKENESKYTGNREIAVTWDDAIVAIKSAPTIEPERKGKWIHEYLASTAGGSYPVIRCSECQGALPFTFEYSHCPICGADMRGEE